MREHRFVLFERRLGPDQRLLGSGDGIFRGGNTCVGFQVLSLGLVDFFLREEFRPAFLHVRKARVGEMSDVKSGLRAA